MWTLIIKEEDQEHDAVPNSWLLNETLCWYPVKSGASAYKLAKDKGYPDPDENWAKIKIKISKRDYDTFEKCFEDAVRLTKGKRSVQSSEDERERHRRPIKKPKMSDAFISNVQAILSEESDYEDGEIVKYKNNTMQKAVDPIKKALFQTAPLHALPRFPSCSQTPGKSNIKSPFSKSTPRKKPRQSGCKKKPEFKHLCSYRKGELSLETIADNLCNISRSLVILKGGIKTSHDEINSKIGVLLNKLIDEAPDGGSKQNDVDKGINIKDIDQEVAALFPISSEIELDKVEKEVERDPTMYTKIKEVFMVHKSTSTARTTTALLKMAFAKEIVVKFTFKGQERNGEKKRSLQSLKVYAALKDAVKGMWPGVSEEVDKTASNWLGQTVNKIKKEVK